MDISSFDDLLTAARQQPAPQRLLMVFAAAELPDDATPDQRAAFDRGEGGALTPLMCVDKTPEELSSFDRLVSESEAMGPAWTMVFVAALSGRAGQSPSSADAQVPMQQMVESIRAGVLGHTIPFDRQGRAVQLN
jgi:hypothetical protein